MILNNNFQVFVIKKVKNWKYVETDSFRDDGAGLGVTGDDLDGVITREKEEDNWW